MRPRFVGSYQYISNETPRHQKLKMHTCVQKNNSRGSKVDQRASKINRVEQVSGNKLG